MRVRIGDTVYDSCEQPVIIQVSQRDISNMSHMASDVDGGQYGAFPENFDQAEARTLTRQDFPPKHYNQVVCPSCQVVVSSFSHLAIGQTFGPWYCDNCGESIHGRVTGVGSADLTVGSTRYAKSLSLLRLKRTPELDLPIRIIVQSGFSYPRDDEPDAANANKEYYFNTHTCPWNYLRLPLAEGDCTDPHGIFVHEETVLQPKDYDPENLESFDDWVKLFPSLQQKA